MTDSETKAVKYFLGSYPNPPLRDDGTPDIECLCGEFLMEGCSPHHVAKMYEQLPPSMVRDIGYDPTTPIRP